MRETILNILNDNNILCKRADRRVGSLGRVRLRADSEFERFRLAGDGVFIIGLTDDRFKDFRNSSLRAIVFSRLIS